MREIKFSKESSRKLFKRLKEGKTINIKNSRSPLRGTICTMRKYGYNIILVGKNKYKLVEGLYQGKEDKPIKLINPIKENKTIYHKVENNPYNPYNPYKHKLNSDTIVFLLMAQAIIQALILIGLFLK